VFREFTYRVGYGGGEERGETRVGIDVKALNKSLGFDLSSGYHNIVERILERRN